EFAAVVRVPLLQFFVHIWHQPMAGVADEFGVELEGELLAGRAPEHQLALLLDPDDDVWHHARACLVEARRADGAHRLTGRAVVREHAGALMPARVIMRGVRTSRLHMMRMWRPGFLGNCLWLNERAVVISDPEDVIRVQFLVYPPPFPEGHSELQAHVGV